MDGNDIARIRSPVGGDGLEFVAILNGSKQVRLERFLVLALDPLSEGDEAMAGIPRLRLPTGFEIIDSICREAPSLSFSIKPLRAGKRSKGTDVVNSASDECSC